MSAAVGNPTLNGEVRVGPRAAKARRFVRGEADLIALAAAWQAHLLRVLDREDEQVLLVPYERLVAEAAPVIAAIEAFAGVTGMDRSIMQRKISTFVGPAARGCSPTGYIEPTALTEREVAVLEDNASEALGRLRAGAGTR